MEFIVGCGVVHYTFRICPIWLDVAHPSCVHIPSRCSCPSDQMFAAGFLQIPSRGGHPCLWL